MVSTVEQWSGKKLSAFTILLLIFFIIFFVIGGSGPKPTSAHLVLFRACLLKKVPNKESMQRPNECDGANDVELNDLSSRQDGRYNNIVFFAKIPPRQYTMSRWFHMIMSTIRFEVEEKLEGDSEIPGKGRLQFTASLFGRQDDTKDWNLIKVSDGSRDIVCSGKHLMCEDVPFFQLHSTFYKSYLINLHIKRLQTLQRRFYLRDIWFSIIHWNTKFSKIFLSLKTVLFPVSLLLLVWYGYHTFGKGRQSWLLERLAFTLGVSVVILNLPVDWIMLTADAPGLTLWHDLRQGFFYAAICCFWLIFVSEHVYDEQPNNSLKSYWKFIIPIILTCLATLVYGLVERGMQINNPFHTVWTTEDVIGLLWAFLILIGCLAGIFAVVLIVLIAMAVLRMCRQRNNSARDKTKSFRLGFLLIATLVTGLMTIGGWIAVNIYEYQLSSGETMSLEISSAFQTGVYGLWNLYSFAVMILVSPAKPREYDEITDIQLEQRKTEGNDSSRRRLIHTTAHSESTSM